MFRFHRALGARGFPVFRGERCQDAGVAGSGVPFHVVLGGARIAKLDIVIAKSSTGHADSRQFRIHRGDDDIATRSPDAQRKLNDALLRACANPAIFLC